MGAPVETRPSDLLTVPEVARLLRVGESTVRKWIAGGRIPFLELPGGEYRIPRTELTRGIRANVDVDKVLERVEGRLSGISDRDITEAVRSVRRGSRRRRR